MKLKIACLNRSKTIEAEPIDLPHCKAMVHQAKYAWEVYEFSSGCIIADGWTREDAIEEARKKLEQRSYEQVRESIGSMPVLNAG